MKRRARWKWSGAAFGLAAGIIAPSCADQDGSCIPGGDGCECVEGSCEVGLECVAGRVCLPPAAAGSDAGSDGGNDGAGPDGSSNPAVPGAPVIVSLQTNQVGLDNYGQPIELTAQVSDPDGLEDLIGGTVTIEPGGLLSGAFTQVSGGTFVHAVTWAEIDDAGLAEEHTSLTLVAEFLDASDNRTSQEVAIEVCPRQHSFCEAPNRCAYLAIDENDCGECGVMCSDSEICSDGDCMYTYADPDDTGPEPELHSVPPLDTAFSLSFQRSDVGPAPDVAGWHLGKRDGG